MKRFCLFFVLFILFVYVFFVVFVVGWLFDELFMIGVIGLDMLYVFVFIKFFNDFEVFEELVNCWVVVVFLCGSVDIDLSVLWILIYIE